MDLFKGEKIILKKGLPPYVGAMSIPLINFGPISIGPIIRGGVCYLTNKRIVGETIFHIIIFYLPIKEIKKVDVVKRFIIGKRLAIESRSPIKIAPQIGGGILRTFLEIFPLKSAKKFEILLSEDSEAWAKKIKSMRRRK